MEQKLIDTLKKYWHYDAFRPTQREAIESILSGRDTLVLMPTGGGKSIIYQLPTLISEGLCIVVTPLISLMKNQVDSLRKRGILATAVHSGMSTRQIDIALDNCTFGDTKFLYVSPERLASEVFRLRLDKMNVSLIAIDEAHCISQWGYDFRPSYLRIAELRKLFPDTPVLALTASATKRVTEDIMKQLHFSEPNILQGSFLRPNLSYCVREGADKLGQIVRIANNVEGSGIVYVRRRSDAENLCKELHKEGISASFYHAGLPSVERAERQDEWIANKVRIMVATNAFGMGIDKPDVRFVVHYSIPESLEAYYQEAGRAGRDGKRSYAVLLAGEEEDATMRLLVESQFPPIEEIKSVYDDLCSFLQIAIGDGRNGSFVFNAYEFCRRTKRNLNIVLNAINLLHLNGYLTLIDESENPARIKFRVTRDDLYSLRLTAEEDAILIATLRLYGGGAFSEFRPIDEMEIASMCRTDVANVHEFLKRLWRGQIIQYIPKNNDPLIHLNEERLPKRDLYIAPETYGMRRERAEERIANILYYATNSDKCRSNMIEHYFIGSESEPCNVCDNCLARKRREAQSRSAESLHPELDDEIIRLANEGLDIRAIAEQIKCNQELLISRIKHLRSEGKLAGWKS